MKAPQGAKLMWQQNYDVQQNQDSVYVTAFFTSKCSVTRFNKGCCLKRPARSTAKALRVLDRKQTE